MSTKIKLTGKVEPMRAYGLRIETEDADLLDATAENLECRAADILRTALKEFFTNHGLR